MDQLSECQTQLTGPLQDSLDQGAINDQEIKKYLYNLSLSVRILGQLAMVRSMLLFFYLFSLYYNKYIILTILYCHIYIDMLLVFLIYTY